MAEFPEELMTLILSKLPVKSLLRFKCVQKSWYSLINSPQFSRQTKFQNDCFLVRRHIFKKLRFRERHDLLSLHSYETLEEDLGNQIKIPFSSVGGLEFCGSCDGLVCFSNRFDQIVICNPTIGELRSLFVPPCVRSGYRIDSVALGSNPNSTGQLYTVVMIGVPDHMYLGEDIYEDRDAWLYDFSTDTWRKTVDVVIPGPFPYWPFAISLNGAFHWCPYRRNSKNILTFHMSNEVTGLIPLPDFAELVTHEKELCVSTKSQLLSLILFVREEGRFVICVMTEYGVKESWTRLFNIGGPLLPNNFEPIAFWDEQRLLLRNAAQLVSCDLQHHQNLRHFPIDGKFDLYPFSQSLVSVNGIGKSIF